MESFLDEAVLAYKEVAGKDATNNIRSILRRRVLPTLLAAYNLHTLQGKNLDYVLENIPLAGFVAVAEPIFQDQILQLKNSNTRKIEKSQWKRFCASLPAQNGDDPLPFLIDPNLKQAKPAYTHLRKGLLSEVRALKKTKENREKPFRLLEQDWTPHLRTQIQEFDHFCQTVTPWQKKAIRPATLQNHHSRIERVLGFRKKIQSVDPLLLDLTDLLDQDVLKAYEEWGRKRGVSSNTIKFDAQIAVHIAQWRFNQSHPEESYSNPEAVKTIRTYLKTIIDYDDRPYVSAEAYAKRELTMQQCWEILAYLGWRCKDLEKQHGLTPQVIDAWMDYLMVAILVTTGARQREVRELRCRNLSFEENSLIVVTLPPEGHKTGSKTDKGREYPLFVGPMQLVLSADLEHYLEHVRPPNLGPDFLFFLRQNRSGKKRPSRRGDPIRGNTYLSTRIPELIACVTAHLYGLDQVKWTAPHDFRRIIATWVCTYGEPKHLAIIAELLGHSMDILLRLYNKMHPGALARQAPVAYDEILAMEERVKEFKRPGLSKTATSMGQMSATTRAAMLQKLVRKLWYSLTNRKQSEVVEALSAAEREAIEA